MKRKIATFDNIRSVEIYIGGFFQGHSTKLYGFDGNGNLVGVNNRDEWNAIKAFLVDNVRVNEWKDDYYDNNVLDGEQWHVNITFEDGTVREIIGSNSYPKRFKMLRDVLGGQFPSFFMIEMMKYTEPERYKEIFGKKKGKKKDGQ
jgi:hypothetical protein